MDPISCVEECERCHRTCLRAAMTYCLEAGADAVESAHFRSLIACSDMCRTTINALLSGDDAEDVCALCAQVCGLCADGCTGLDELQNCVEACRRCALACTAASRHALPV